MKESDSDAAKKHGGGPKTPEGKARSARNALRHGPPGNSVVLPSEDPAKFQALLEDHVREFDPDNTTQMDLVHEMAVCRWRLQRIATMESCMFEISMARTERAANAEFKNPDPDTRFPSPEDLYDGLALDPAGWTPERLDRPRREATGPNGQTATVTDTVVAVRRVP